MSRKGGSLGCIAAPYSCLDTFPSTENVYRCCFPFPLACIYFHEKTHCDSPTGMNLSDLTHTGCVLLVC